MCRSARHVIRGRSSRWTVLVRPTLVILSVVVALAVACEPEPLGPAGVDPDAPGAPGGPDDPNEPDVPEELALVADLVVDTNRDGVLERADEVGEERFDANAGAILIANVDDDDADGTRDSRDDTLGDDADRED